MTENERMWEAVIGVEVHVELKTATKAFCACPTTFGLEPNTAVCPFCLGMPGVLPRLNGQAVRYAVMAGMALHGTIHRKTWFDRKNYTYPDLPKGYQITQYERPFVTDGYVEVPAEDTTRRIRIERIHLEEDAGKLLHRVDGTYIDCNRAGVPLIEIVSAPDLRSPADVRAYLTELRRRILYIGVSDCRMNEGSMRCDLNVSVHHPGEPYGTRCEIKNVNSIQYAGRAVEDEVRRQIEILTRGERVAAETRRFNESTGRTETMRQKEDTIDYRYFPEPDIPPVILSDTWIAEIRGAMPPMPEVVERNLSERYGLPPEDLRRIATTPARVRYFKKAASESCYPRVCANLYIGSLLPGLPEDGVPKLKPEWLGETAALFGDGKIGSTAAKKLLAMAETENLPPHAIAAREEMYLITDPETLAVYVHRAICTNEKAVLQYRNGKKTAAKAILGAIFRETGGRADPTLTEKLLMEALDTV